MSCLQCHRVQRFFLVLGVVKKKNLTPRRTDDSSKSFHEPSSALPQTVIIHSFLQPSQELWKRFEKENESNAGQLSRKMSRIHTRTKDWDVDGWNSLVPDD